MQEEVHNMWNNGQKWSWFGSVRERFAWYERNLCLLTGVTAAVCVADQTLMALELPQSHQEQFWMSHKTSKAESSMLVLLVSFIETRLKMTSRCVIKRTAPLVASW